MDKLVLVDSSVWIAYFRKDEASFAAVNNLADNRRVCLVGLILAELLQGCKSKKEINIISDLADVFPRLEELPGMWEEAGILSFKLRKKGRKICLADCYIATVAAKTGALIFSYDKHFEELAPVCGMEIYKPG